MVKADNDRAGRKKQERFEKRVREKMKHGRFIRNEPDRHEHVTELRDGGIGEDPFDVGLLCRDQRAEQRGDCSDPRDD